MIVKRKQTKKAIKKKNNRKKSKKGGASMVIDFTSNLLTNMAEQYLLDRTQCIIRNCAIGIFKYENLKALSIGIINFASDSGCKKPGERSCTFKLYSPFIILGYFFTFMIFSTLGMAFTIPKLLKIIKHLTFFPDILKNYIGSFIPDNLSRVIEVSKGALLDFIWGKIDYTNVEIAEISEMTGEVAKTSFLNKISNYFKSAASRINPADFNNNGTAIKKELTSLAENIQQEPKYKIFNFVKSIWLTIRTELGPTKVFEVFNNLIDLNDQKMEEIVDTFSGNNEVKNVAGCYLGITNLEKIKEYITYYINLGENTLFWIKGIIFSSLNLVFNSIENSALKQGTEATYTMFLSGLPKFFAEFYKRQTINLYLNEILSDVKDIIKALLPGGISSTIPNDLFSLISTAFSAITDPQKFVSCLITQLIYLHYDKFYNILNTIITVNDKNEFIFDHPLFPDSPMLKLSFTIFSFLKGIRKDDSPKDEQKQKKIATAKKLIEKINAESSPPEPEKDPKLPSLLETYNPKTFDPIVNFDTEEDRYHNKFFKLIIK